MEYTAVIRTLGKAGEKYQTLLNSLISQTLPPSDIYVYIADGYPKPKETVGVERYIYVKKGMVAQRALVYDDVTTDYILFLDDDLYLPNDAVEILFSQLNRHSADIISPDVFPNASRPFYSELLMTLSGRMRARRHDNIWGYKVMRTSGFSYNKNPTKDVYLSQANAGPCLLCKKKTFIETRFQDELWLDKMEYPLGEDEVLFYKMYKLGYKQLTSFNTGILHLDAGSSRVDAEKTKRITYSDFYFKTVFWHRFIFLPEKSKIVSLYDILCISYALIFTLFISMLKFNFTAVKIKYSAIKDAIMFIRSDEYKRLPLIPSLEQSIYD